MESELILDDCTASRRRQSGVISSQLALIGMAALFTLLDAVKPLVIDDPAGRYYAVQAAQKPLDPYGFAILWYERPEPANEVLMPPLVPYWLAVPIRLFGERPFVWKLWLFPFAYLLATALYQLADRFVGRFQLLVPAFTLFGPAILPSFNLMLDIPALALNLTAVALFMRSGERKSRFLIGLSGLVAGLAMQTKYTGFTAPAIILLYGLVFGRYMLALMAAGLAGAVFCGWEIFLYGRYGQSHFLYHLLDTENTHVPKYYLALPLFGVLGGVGAGIGLLHAIALGVSLRGLARYACLVVLGYLAIALIPEPYVGFEWHLGSMSERFTWAAGFYGIFGVLILSAILLSLGRLIRLRFARSKRWRPRHRTDFFLALWFGLELAGYFALSPWAAVRRIFGIWIVSTLIGWRLAARTARQPTRKWLLGWVAACNLALGALFYGVDMVDAQAERDAAQQAAAFIATQRPGQIWYVGHWGFQYYAEQAGMRPLIPGESVLTRDDWLVVPDERIDQQKVAINPDTMALVHEIDIIDRLPLRTMRAYYAGYTPMEHHEGPRVRVFIYRVLRDCTADARPIPGQ